MDKRSFLKTFAGRKTGQRTSSMAPATTLNGGLDPYSGTWGFEQAAHLLRRSTYGPTKEQINQAIQDGLETTIQKLFEIKPLPDPPVYFDYENDPLAGLGETWITTPPSDVGGLAAARRRSLVAWTVGLMNEGGTSIIEKMVLFWHNHFALSAINNAQYSYQYMNAIRENALGNFRTLVEEMTIAPAMLLFLNGNENSVQAPNENYSRELLELFTIGRGPVAGPGDYTNYTEQDVAEMARALTGWRARNRDTGEIIGVFDPNRHDTGDKQLSYRFDNTVIGNGGENEYKLVIDIILRKSETARFICRQLYIWFVGSDITPDIEANVIEPMSQQMVAEDYEISGALQTLLSSEHFFDESVRGCMINHPFDYMYKIVNTMEFQTPEELVDRYQVWRRLFIFGEVMQMTIMGLPSVAGWQAFYQEPQYYQFWVNSVTLPLREEFAGDFIDGFRTRGITIKLDPLAFVAKLDNALEPNEMLEEISRLFFVFPLAQNQLDFLKEVLIPGLPDFEWTVEYSAYLANPDDEDARNAVLTKLEAVFLTVFKMPEFYLI